MICSQYTGTLTQLPTEPILVGLTVCARRSGLVQDALWDVSKRSFGSKNKMFFLPNQQNVSRT